MHRTLFVLALLGLAAVCTIFGQSASVPRFTELSHKNSDRLDRQRTVVAKIAKSKYGTAALTKTKSDLPVLQKLIDDRAFSKSQTYELQCLGIAFGDVLANELPLHWVMITDEYGTDPTLRYKYTDININALTMISKRVERGEQVNLSELLTTTRRQLSRLVRRVR